MWRKLRIGLLLAILALAAWSNFYDRLSTTDWDETLTIGVFPIDEGSDEVARRYVANLKPADVADIEEFLNEEAREYGITIPRPVSVQLFPPVTEPPPERAPDAGIPATMWWSLKMRMYASRASRASGLPAPQIRIFVRFHDPDFTQSVPHSVGLQKGLVGVVHAFATHDMRGSNNVVIAHEILHTLGASDKYDLLTSAPIFPLGYAEPQRQPLLPQPFAEIMAGRRAIAPGEFAMPASLAEVIVGKATAREIRWLRQ